MGARFLWLYLCLRFFFAIYERTARTKRKGDRAHDAEKTFSGREDAACPRQTESETETEMEMEMEMEMDTETQKRRRQKGVLNKKTERSFKQEDRKEF